MADGDRRDALRRAAVLRDGSTRIYPSCRSKGVTMKRLSMTILLLGSLATASVLAQAASSGATSQSAPPMTDAEVRKVDKDAAKITLKHGELKNLEMPAMTMVFQVKDKAMLDQVRTGDRVRFTADKIGGAFTITHIEPAK